MVDTTTTPAYDVDIWHDPEGIWAQVGPVTLGPFGTEEDAKAAVWEQA